MTKFNLPRKLKFTPLEKRAEDLKVSAMPFGDLDILFVSRYYDGPHEGICRYQGVVYRFQSGHQDDESDYWRRTYGIYKISEKELEDALEKARALLKKNPKTNFIDSRFLSEDLSVGGDHNLKELVAISSDCNDPSQEILGWAEHILQEIPFPCQFPLFWGESLSFEWWCGDINFDFGIDPDMSGYWSIAKNHYETTLRDVEFSRMSSGEISDFLFEVREFLIVHSYPWIQDVYRYMEDGKRRKAIDILFEKIDDLFLAGEFKEVDCVLGVFDTERLSHTLLIALLSITLVADSKLEHRESLYWRIKKRLDKEVPGRSERKLKGLYSQLGEYDKGDKNGDHY